MAGHQLAATDMTAHLFLNKDGSGCPAMEEEAQHLHSKLD